MSKLTKENLRATLLGVMKSSLTYDKPTEYVRSELAALYAVGVEYGIDLMVEGAVMMADYRDDK